MSQDTRNQVHNTEKLMTLKLYQAVPKNMSHCTHKKMVNPKLNLNGMFPPSYRQTFKSLSTQLSTGPQGVGIKEPPQEAQSAA